MFFFYKRPTLGKKKNLVLIVHPSIIGCLHLMPECDSLWALMWKRLFFQVLAPESRQSYHDILYPGTKRYLEYSVRVWKHNCFLSMTRHQCSTTECEYSLSLLRVCVGELVHPTMTWKVTRKQSSVLSIQRVFETRSFFNGPYIM